MTSCQKFALKSLVKKKEKKRIHEASVAKLW